MATPTAEVAAVDAPQPTVEPSVSLDAGSTTEAAGEGTGTPDEPAPPVSEAPWEGGNIVALLETRMQELSAPIGSPFTPEAVAALFESPTDFPYPSGTITGVLFSQDLDERVDEQVVIREDRMIGTDGDPTAAALDDIAASVGEENGSRWSRSSSQRQEGQAFNDLFTAEDGDGDGQTDRLLITGDIAPDPDESPVKITVEFGPSAMAEPQWLDGLPRPEGGRLVELSEGIGLVRDFGRAGGNGTIVARWAYPVELTGELQTYFESGVLSAAGFELDEISFRDNGTFSEDVRIGDWEGSVRIATYSIGDQDPAGFHVLWALNRS